MNGLGRTLALLVAACSAPHPTPAQRAADAPSPAVAARPLASGPVTVRGGEVIELAGARVEVGRIIYLNRPCPEGAQCVISGVIKQVELRVVRWGTSALVSLSEGERKVESGVEIVVRSVRPGPEAEIEVSLPLRRSR